MQRELFNNGRGTSATLTDAETDLTRARLTLLNARADARIARIRLDHALGRDVRPALAAAGARSVSGGLRSRSTRPLAARALRACGRALATGPRC